MFLINLTTHVRSINELLINLHGLLQMETTLDEEKPWPLIYNLRPPPVPPVIFFYIIIQTYNFINKFQSPSIFD